MNNQTSVEVFLGNPITVASEQQFLARVRRDLLVRGISARILANLLVGKDCRQLDFLIVTAHRVAQVELKKIHGRVVAGPKNGPWRVQIGARIVRELDNPPRQAREITHALSDELYWFARGVAVPGPRGSKFYSGIDTVVCAFPSLPHGSSVEPQDNVKTLGYADLLDRLGRPGPTLRWSSEHWDALCRHLNLYRAEEDAPEELVRRAGAAAVEEYLGRYLQAQGEQPTLVSTRVRVDGGPAERPVLTASLPSGQAILLHGDSGSGKTLWATSTAIQLARAGQVPIWLAAGSYEESFRTSAARSIAPFTALSLTELLRAADEAGRSVVFVIDDLTRTSDDARRALVSGVQVARVRNGTSGLLMTAQTAEIAGTVTDCVAVELAVPDERERQAVLDAYGAPEIIDRCGAFVSPLELALAAECAAALPPEAGVAELLDRYVDHVLRGDEQMRGALRAVALRMHSELRPSLPKPEVSRSLRRDHRVSVETLQALPGCPLLMVTHGRVAFRHERFERFLAAEGLLLSAADVGALGRTLNTPRCAEIRADVIALESRDSRVNDLLSACEDPEVLAAAAAGRLGATAARVADALLRDTLALACAQTTVPGLAFRVSGVFDGRWETPSPPGPAMAAQLIALGRLVSQGRFLDGVVRLFDLTDAVCDATRPDAGEHAAMMAQVLFAGTYMFHTGGGLPASTLMWAARDHTPAPGPQASETAAALLRASDGLGTLYLVANLLHRSDDLQLTTQVITRCVTSGVYHLELEGLQLAEGIAGCG
jgi:hypothetical protein